MNVFTRVFVIVFFCQALGAVPAQATVTVEINSVQIKALNFDSKSKQIMLTLKLPAVGATGATKWKCLSIWRTGCNMS